MSNNFTAATKKIQDLMTLYNRLDSLPNRGQWRFEQTYGNYNTCAFVFSHTNGDSAKRYDNLNMLSNVLSDAGIKNSLIAQQGVIADVIIAPEYAELARKMFAGYQENGKAKSKVNDAQLEQEWLRQRQK